MIAGVTGASEVTGSSEVTGASDVVGASDVTGAPDVAGSELLSVVVATSAAAAANELEAAALIIQYGSQTPAAEHTATAALEAETTSAPLQFSAKQSATLEAQLVITQRHPVSQYGHGVEEVERETHFLAQAGNLS